MKILDEQQTAAALQAYGLDQPSGAGFVFADPARDVFYDWHDHDYHQLLYVRRGAAMIETAAGRHLVPSGRGAWIPARLRHRTRIGELDAASLYFAPEADEPASEAPASRGLKILIASPLLREMFSFAARWPLGADADPVAARFFAALKSLAAEALDADPRLSLPGAREPALLRSQDYALADLAAASLAGACAAAHMSERSFRRKFLAETGLSWRDWLTRARMLRAMDHFQRGAAVSETALAVGYDLASAFARAFAATTGETPAVFRAAQTRRA